MFMTIFPCLRKETQAAEILDNFFEASTHRARELSKHQAETLKLKAM